MSEIHWRVAETRSQLDEAQRVRWACIREELGIGAREEAALRRDVCALDGLASVHHIVVYRGRQAVGTARLVQADAGVARARGLHYGFELEQQVDLRGLGLAGTLLGEVGRLCVLREHAAHAVARLYEGLYSQSRALKIRYWIGGVDSGTADPERARRLYAELVRGGLISPEWHLGVRCERPANDTETEASRSRCPDGNAQSRGRARVPPLLPQALGSFVRRLNGRAIAPPVPHPHFERQVLPMIADLEALPASTLALFDASVTATYVMPQPLCAPLVRVAHESLKQLDRHPVGRALINGSLSREAYVAYLTQVIHQVRDSAPMLARAAERLEQLGRERLAQVFRRKASEENGHDVWALEDLAALGVSRESALATPCCSAVKAYAAWWRHCAERAPTALLGLAFILELFGSARAGRAADNLVRRGAIDGIESAVRFLRGHGAADEGHLQAFSEPFAEITSAHEMDAIVLSARLTANLYLGLLDWAGTAAGSVRGASNAAKHRAALDESGLDHPALEDPALDGPALEDPALEDPAGDPGLDSVA